MTARIVLHAYHDEWSDMSITALAEIVERHNWERTVVGARFPFRAGCSCGWIGEAQGGDKAHSVHVAIELEEYVHARVAEALAPIEALAAELRGSPPFLGLEGGAFSGAWIIDRLRAAVEATP